MWKSTWKSASTYPPYNPHNHGHHNSVLLWPSVWVCAHLFNKWWCAIPFSHTTRQHIYKLLNTAITTTMPLTSQLRMLCTGVILMGVWKTEWQCGEHVMCTIHTHWDAWWCEPLADGQPLCDFWHTCPWCSHHAWDWLDKLCFDGVHKKDTGLPSIQPLFVPRW